MLLLQAHVVEIVKVFRLVGFKDVAQVNLFVVATSLALVRSGATVGDGISLMAAWEWCFGKLSAAVRVSNYGRPHVNGRRNTGVS